MASRPPRSSSRSGSSKRSSSSAPRPAPRASTRSTTGARASAPKSGAANRSRKDTSTRAKAPAAPKKPATRPPKKSTPAKRTTASKPAPPRAKPKPKPKPKVKPAAKKAAPRAKKPKVELSERMHNDAVKQRLAAQKRAQANVSKAPYKAPRSAHTAPKGFKSKSVTGYGSASGVTTQGIEGVAATFNAVAENMKIMSMFWDGIYAEFSTMEQERFANGGPSPSFGISDRWKEKSFKTNRSTTKPPLTDRGYLRNAAVSPHMVRKRDAMELIIDPRQGARGKQVEDYDYGHFHQDGTGRGGVRREFVTITPAWQRVVNVVARNTIFAPLYKLEPTPSSHGAQLIGYSPRANPQGVGRTKLIRANRAAKLLDEQKRIRQEISGVGRVQVMRESFRTSGGAKARSSASYTLEQEFPRLGKKMHLQAPWKSAAEHEADIKHVFKNIDWYTGKKGATLSGNRKLTRAEGMKIINEATSHTFGTTVRDGKFGR